MDHDLVYSCKIVGIILKLLHTYFLTSIVQTLTSTPSNISWLKSLPCFFSFFAIVVVKIWWAILWSQNFFAQVKTWILCMNNWPTFHGIFYSAINYFNKINLPIIQNCHQNRPSVSQFSRSLDHVTWRTRVDAILFFGKFGFIKVKKVKFHLVCVI